MPNDKAATIPGNVGGPDSRERYSIGPFQLDAEQKVLSRGPDIVPLTPKAIDVLIALARRKGEVASKEELFTAAWPDTFVDDSTLAKVIYTLRRDLGPLPDGRPLIENIPKRGYRLVPTGGVGESGAPPADVSVEASAAKASPEATGPGLGRHVTVAIVSLVVVLFATLVVTRTIRDEPAGRVDLLVMAFTAEGSEEEAVARGIGDFLTSRLARVSGLSIIPPSLAGSETTLDAERTARRLGADVILTGVISRAGDRIRVSCRLTTADDRRLIGAESLETTAGDIFEIEERIAAWIVTNLRLQQSLRESGDPALSTPDRQRTYVRAVGFLRPNTPEPRVDQAIALLESLNPEGRSSPLVLTALGRAYLDRFRAGNEPQDLELAEQYVEQAAALDAEHPRVRALLGAILRARGRFDEAAAELRAALAFEPDAPDVLMDLASIYNALGRQNEAESTLEYLLEVHPRCAVCAARAGRFHSQNGRLERAIEMYGRAIELAPDVATFHASLGAVHIKLGRYAEAVPLLETATRVSPSAISSSNLGYCHYLMGDFHEAARHFGEAVRLAPRSFLYRGNLGDALRLLPDHGDEANAAFDAAIDLARDSLAINENDPLTRALLAEYLAKRGDLETANAEISRALSETSPDVADIYLSAGIVRMLSGENAAATAFLRNAMDAGLSPSIVAVDPQFEPLHSEPEFARLIQTEP